MNILNMTLLINIYSKNYKKDSPKWEKMCSKSTNDSLLPWVNPSAQFSNSLPFPKYGEFTASAMLSDKN